MPELPSFVSIDQPSFSAADIRVDWRESEFGQSYMLHLGPNATMRLIPADARVLLTKLVAKMIEHGDLPETELLEALAVRVAERAQARLAEAAEAETRQWDIVNATSHGADPLAEFADLTDVTVISDEHMADLRGQVAEKQIGGAS